MFQLTASRFQYRLVDHLLTIWGEVILMHPNQAHGYEQAQQHPGLQAKVSPTSRRQLRRLLVNRGHQSLVWPLGSIKQKLWNILKANYGKEEWTFFEVIYNRRYQIHEPANLLATVVEIALSWGMQKRCDTISCHCYPKTFSQLCCVFQWKDWMTSVK